MSNKLPLDLDELADLPTASGTSSTTQTATFIPVAPMPKIKMPSVVVSKDIVEKKMREYQLRYTLDDEMIPIRSSWAGWGWGEDKPPTEAKPSDRKEWVDANGLAVGDKIWGCCQKPDVGLMGVWEGWSVTNGDMNDYRSLVYLRNSRPKMWFYISARETENEFGPVSP